LRIGTLTDSSLIARPLGRFRVINCASPAYLERYGTPTCLEDLAQHQLIHYVATLGAKSLGWEYFDGAGNRSMNMPGAITVNNADAYQTSCLAGLGLIQVPAIGVLELIENGQLIEVLPQFRAEPMPVSLLYAHRRNLSQRVQMFMEWMSEILKPHLDPAT
jgi:DNA-binding transcriptional LysR family regulator